MRRILTYLGLTDVELNAKLLVGVGCSHFESN
jgi:hypothetical protein